MRTILLLLSALVLACGGGGGGGAPAAPTLEFLNLEDATLRTVGPTGATLRIAYRDDAGVPGATTSFYAERDGARLPIVLDRTHGDGADQEIDWDLSVVPEGVYTIVGETDDGENPVVIRAAAGNVTVTVERELTLISGGYDGAIGVTTFPDGSYAVAGRMLMPHYQLRGSVQTIVFGSGEPNETTLQARIGHGFVARYEWDGSLRWVHRTYGSSLDYLAYHTSVAAMPDGGVVVKGEHVGDVTLDKGGPNEVTVEKEGNGLDARLISRYGPDGALQWAFSMRGQGGGSGGIVADELGAIYVADTAYGGSNLQGLTAPSFGQRDAVVARLDSDGRAVWLRRYGSAHEDTLSDVALAKDGGVWICGHHTLTIEFRNFVLPDFGGYIARIDATGYATLAVNFTADDHVAPFVEVTGVTEVPDGSILATGRFTGTPRFGALQTRDDRAAGAESGAFILKMGENGTVQWLRLMDGLGADICAHDDGTATVLGRFSGSLRADGFTVPAVGGWDRFLLRLASDGLALGLRAGGVVGNDIPSKIAALPDRSTVAVGSAYQLAGWQIPHGVVHRIAAR